MQFSNEYFTIKLSKEKELYQLLVRCNSISKTFIRKCFFRHYLSFLSFTFVIFRFILFQERKQQKTLCVLPSVIRKALSILSSSLPCSLRPHAGAQLNGLRQMHRLNILAARKVRNRACHLQDAVMAAGA